MVEARKSIMSVSCFKLRIKILFSVIRVFEIMDTLAFPAILRNKPHSHFVMTWVKESLW